MANMTVVMPSCSGDHNWWPPPPTLMPQQWHLPVAATSTETFCTSHYGRCVRGSGRVPCCIVEATEGTGLEYHGCMEWYGTVLLWYYVMVNVATCMCGAYSNSIETVTAWQCREWTMNVGTQYADSMKYRVWIWDWVKGYNSMPLILSFVESYVDKGPHNNVNVVWYGNWCYLVTRMEWITYIRRNVMFGVSR